MAYSTVNRDTLTGLTERFTAVKLQQGPHLRIHPGDSLSPGSIGEAVLLFVKSPLIRTAIN